MTITMREFIDREVVYCASSLFQVLIKAAAEAPKQELDDGTTYEELLELAERRDFEGPVDYYIDHSMDRDELIEALEEYDVEDERDPAVIAAVLEDADRADPDGEDESLRQWPGLSDKELRAVLFEHLNKSDDIEQFASERNIEPDIAEVFEHWIVTNWLAEKLAEKGEVVARNICGLTLWGRCTTGQAISMDGVIKAIYKDLTGQEAGDD